MKHYEYAVTCGPGTLVDHGEIRGVSVISKLNGYQSGNGILSPLVWMIVEAFESDQIVTIGPVEYDTSGETISIKGDE